MTHFIACYFNSLVQSYFYLPTFTSKILQDYQKQIMSPLGFLEKADSLGEGDEMMRKRKLHAKNLVENLAKLFAQMILANRKYVDPTCVLKTLTDDFGNQIHVGE